MYVKFTSNRTRRSASSRTVDRQKAIIVLLAMTDVDTAHEIIESLSGIFPCRKYPGPPT